ncbi:hypothetical protein HA402_010003 [Bradysia odoriphaga]|nr:hypothetical protein HA402_010003 [Bradysia odoriphaga]
MALWMGLLALGTWQVQRLAWKQDLIARVEQRVHADPADLSDPAQWIGLNRADDEYRRVRLSGVFLHEQETLVQANTELGAGFWVLTPLRLANGAAVLINRGFVPPEARQRAVRLAGEPQGRTTVIGLLRLSEPGGAFLRDNNPAADRWYSRDVQAIAAARGLSNAAPYFVDAQMADADDASNGRWPVAGLTVLVFKNNHLVYAITWYILALMLAGAVYYVGREEYRLRRRQPTLDSDKVSSDESAR